MVSRQESAGAFPLMAVVTVAGSFPLVGVTLLVVGVVVRLVVSTANGAFRTGGEPWGASSRGELESSSLEDTKGAVAPFVTAIDFSGTAVASITSFVTMFRYAAQMHSHTKRY